jgi:hypothetical protein
MAATGARSGGTSATRTGDIAEWPCGWIRNGSTSWCPTRLT